jgi:hypothetical protein
MNSDQPAMTGPRNPPPARTPKDLIPIDVGFGKVDLRTPGEEIEFQECETIVREGWAHFALVGTALATIRDKQLYKNEYHSFEEYCQHRWGFGRAHVWRYISAAEVHKTLATIPGMPVPECEAQIRPLIGLPGDLAQQAWLHALSRTRGGPVSARLVKRAVKEVLKNEPSAAPKPSLNPQQRYETRRTIKQGFVELFTLLLERAEHGILIGKLQALERAVGTLLNPKKKR